MLTKLYRQALFRHRLNETWQENIMLGIAQPIPDDYREMFEPCVLVDEEGRRLTYPPWIRTVDYLIADFEADDLKRGLPSGTWIKEAEVWLKSHDASTAASTPKPTDSGPVSPPLP